MEIARSRHFVYERTENAVAPDQRKILREFERIYREMDRYGGWTPATPVGIHVVEDAKWPDPRWAAYSNGDGLFLRASVMEHDQGNWCHEMTHLMFQGRVPRWIDESLVHALTKQVWVPRLYPKLPERVNYKDDVKKSAEAFRASQGDFESLQFVLNVLIDRYGADVYGRFFHACSAAAKRGELTLEPEHQMSTAETVKYLSQAAGEDVTPILRRWKGFAGVQ